MRLSLLADFLASRLKRSLPGDEAHDLMKPLLPNGMPIRIKHPQKPKESSVLILFYEQNDIIKFPLIQRSEYQGAHSGQVALPGGKKESIDQTLFDTALRETEEEIGIAKGEITILGNLSNFYVAASNHDVFPVIGMINGVPAFNPDGREVVEVLSPALTELTNPLNLKNKDITVSKGIVLKSPYYHLQERVVWGATAMMLSELVTILKEIT